MTPASALYAGVLRHRRFTPVVRTFRYGVFHAALDLDELSVLDRHLRLFAYNRPGVVAFRDRDHLGPLDAPVRDKLAVYLRRHGHTLAPDDRVVLHANLRVFGHVFDPVSWFHVHDRAGRLRLVVAEVHNTFGEIHCYLLDDLEAGRGATHRSRRAKRFHVSPFQRVEGAYRFTIGDLGPRHRIHIDVLDPAGRRIFDATLDERRRPLTDAQLARLLLRYPWVTLKTSLAIRWQALRLWLAGVAWSRKPPPPPDELPRASDDLQEDHRAAS